MESIINTVRGGAFVQFSSQSIFKDHNRAVRSAEPVINNLPLVDHATDRIAFLWPHKASPSGKWATAEQREISRWSLDGHRSTRQAEFPRAAATWLPEAEKLSSYKKQIQKQFGFHVPQYLIHLCTNSAGHHIPHVFPKLRLILSWLLIKPSMLETHEDDSKFSHID